MSSQLFQVGDKSTHQLSDVIHLTIPIWCSVAIMEDTLRASPSTQCGSGVDTTRLGVGVNLIPIESTVQPQILRIPRKDGIVLVQCFDDGGGFGFVDRNEYDSRDDPTPDIHQKPSLVSTDRAIGTCVAYCGVWLSNGVPLWNINTSIRNSTCGG